jgi:hypothetical protein
MTTTITQLTKTETQDLLEKAKVSNRMDVKLVEALREQGWTFYEYSIEKNYKGYPIVIEFCLGDFCTYPCSKKGHYLLEKKYPAPTFLDALIHVIKIETQIDEGHHWIGEED